MTENRIDVLDKGFVQLLGSMGDDLTIAQTARTSYQGIDKEALTTGDIQLIHYLMKHHHTSPFEFVQFHFLIKCPILVTRQWHRHRTWSYNEWSGRYTELPDEAYLPSVDRIRSQSKNNKQGSSAEKVVTADLINQSMEDEQLHVFKNYKTYIEADVAKEIARLNVPVATYTQFRASVDLHNLFHFLALRRDSHAQEEIRVYADAIYALIYPIVPVACDAWEEHVFKAKHFSGVEMEFLRALIGNLSYEQKEPLLVAASETMNSRNFADFTNKLGLT